MKRKSLLAKAMAGVALAAAVLCGSADSVIAQTACSGPSGCTVPPSQAGRDGGATAWAPGSQITVRLGASGFSSNETAEIGAAVAAINGMAGIQAHGVKLVLDTTTAAPSNELPVSGVISIYSDPTHSTGGVASYMPYMALNSSNQTTDTIAAGGIFINKSYTLGSNNTPAYNPALSSAAQFFTDLAIHELLHELGLADMPEPLDTNGVPNPCLQTPGASAMNGYCGAGNISHATFHALPMALQTAHRSGSPVIHGKFIMCGSYRLLLQLAVAGRRYFRNSTSSMAHYTAGPRGQKALQWSANSDRYAIHEFFLQITVKV